MEEANTNIERTSDKFNDKNSYSDKKGKKDYLSTPNASGNASMSQEKVRSGPMEVVVDTNVEKAMKVLKRKLIKEGIFKELKSRRYFEKPSLKRKRKNKEAYKKMRKDEARLRRNVVLF